MGLSFEAYAALRKLKLELHRLTFVRWNILDWDTRKEVRYYCNMEAIIGRRSSQWRLGHANHISYDGIRYK